MGPRDGRLSRVVYIAAEQLVEHRAVQGRLQVLEPPGDVRTVQDAMVKELKPSADDYRRAFLYLSHHGGATCTERDPHCSICPLLKDCPEGKKRLKSVASDSFACAKFLTGSARKK